jgi:integrase
MNATDLIPITQTSELATIERPAVQHQPMAEFIALALAACGSESENTRRAYTRAWGDFLAFISDIWGLPRPLAAEEKILRDDGKMTRTLWTYAGDTRIFSKITPSLRDGFIQALVDKSLARATRNQRKNAVNTLLGIAYRDGYISDDLARRLDVRPYHQRQKQDIQPTGRRLKPDEVRTLRTSVELRARNHYKALRDVAIVDLMLFTGLRRAEVASLTPDNFKQDGGRWWIVLTGKGQKTRKVKVHDALYRSLETWAKAAGLTLGEGSEPLFTNLAKGGAPTESTLDESVIGRLVAEYGAAAGLAPRKGENRLSPHDLRRTCARNAYDNGASLILVQQMLGHSDPKTTTRYIGALENDDQTAVDFVRY